MPVVVMTRTQDGPGIGSSPVVDVWPSPSARVSSGQHHAVPLADCCASFFPPIGEAPLQLLQQPHSSPMASSCSINSSSLKPSSVQSDPVLLDAGLASDSVSIAEFTFEKYRLLCAEATNDLASMGRMDLAKPSRFAEADSDCAAAPVKAGDGDGGAGPQPSVGGPSKPVPEPPLEPWPDPVVSSASGLASLAGLARRAWRPEAGFEVTARRAWTAEAPAQEGVAGGAPAPFPSIGSRLSKGLACNRGPSGIVAHVTPASQPPPPHACSPLPTPVPSARADQEVAARRARDVARELERLVDVAIERKIGERESVIKRLESFSRGVAAVAIHDRSRRVLLFPA